MDGHSQRIVVSGTRSPGGDQWVETSDKWCSSEIGTIDYGDQYYLTSLLISETVGLSALSTSLATTPS